MRTPPSPSWPGKGRLGGFRIEGYWRGIDTVKDIMEASAELGVSNFGLGFLAHSTEGKPRRQLVGDRGIHQRLEGTMNAVSFMPRGSKIVSRK